MDKLVPPLDAGDYGKMPARFYENSQEVGPTTSTDEDAAEQAGPTQATGEEADTPNVDQTDSQPVKSREPLLPRDKWDGVDSDDETDEEDLHGDMPLPTAEESAEAELGDDEDEEDRPALVGDVEIDMEDEQDEFLEFARSALGISDDMWRAIVQERTEKGGELQGITFLIGVADLSDWIIPLFHAPLHTKLFFHGRHPIIQPKTTLPWLCDWARRATSIRTHSRRWISKG